MCYRKWFGFSSVLLLIALYLDCAVAAERVRKISEDKFLEKVEIIAENWEKNVNDQTPIYVHRKVDGRDYWVIDRLVACEDFTVTYDVNQIGDNMFGVVEFCARPYTNLRASKWLGFAESEVANYADGKYFSVGNAWSDHTHLYPNRRIVYKINGNKLILDSGGYNSLKSNKYNDAAWLNVLELELD